MESHTRIIKRFKVLLFSIRREILSGRSWNFPWFRRSTIPCWNSKNRQLHPYRINPINRGKRESVLKISARDSLNPYPETHGSRLHRLLNDKYLRRCDKVEIEPNQQSKRIIKQIKKILMKSRLRILRWLSLLLLSAGLQGLSQRLLYENKFRRCEFRPTDTKSKLHNNIIFKLLNSLIMASRLRILRWLSLLLLSAGLVGWSQRISPTSKFRRDFIPNDHHTPFSLKNMKQIIQTINRTMEIHLRILHWLSLLQLSENSRWQRHNLILNLVPMPLTIQTTKIEITIFKINPKTN